MPQAAWLHEQIRSHGPSIFIQWSSQAGSRPNAPSTEDVSILSTAIKSLDHVTSILSPHLMYRLFNLHHKHSISSRHFTSFHVKASFWPLFFVFRNSLPWALRQNDVPRSADNLMIVCLLAVEYLIYLSSPLFLSAIHIHHNQIMVNLKIVRASNHSLQDLPPGLVAVFAGATDGIGLGTLRALARNANAPRAYIIGRSHDKAAHIIDKLKTINPAGSFIFVEGQVSLIHDVDRICEEIKKVETHIDILCMSPGYLNLAGKHGRLLTSTTMSSF